VLRHSLTRKGGTGRGSALSAEGVALARHLGGRLPAVDYVAVGDQPRHLETAIALGFAVDEQVTMPSGYVVGEVNHHDQWEWERPYTRYAELLTAGGELNRVVEAHLDLWRHVLEHVSEGGTGLVISSGGSIEPVLVAALPALHHDTWGGPLHQLEGATLTWDTTAFREVRFVRRSDDTTHGPG
jgi:broad specificity phosphatase PhoE